MSGYQDYFKKRREVDYGPTDKRQSKGSLRTQESRVSASRRRAGSGRSRSSSLWLMIVASALAGVGGWLLCGGDETAQKLLSRVEISVLGAANAADEVENKEATDDKGGDKKKAEEGSTETSDGKATKQAKAEATKSWSPEEIALLTKLEDRKKQLDAREATLKQVEEELQRQRLELEKRLAELESVRGNIASKLESKVKVDQQKVDSLVSVYQNMKPAQAAKIMEGINEDLAVEVLSKMKNKAAAEILNLMDAEKAKHITERFVGYRLPAEAK